MSSCIPTNTPCNPDPGISETRRCCAPSKCVTSDSGDSVCTSSCAADGMACKATSDCCVSHDCVGGVCVTTPQTSYACKGDAMCVLQNRVCEPGETGCYSSQGACQSACASFPPYSYACKGDAMCAFQQRACGANEAGCHADLSSCQTACAKVPVTTYVCDGKAVCSSQGRVCGPTESNCYSTLESCKMSCVKPMQKFSCDKGACVIASDGQFSTLSGCRTSGCGLQAYEPVHGSVFTGTSGPMSTFGIDSLMRTSEMTEGLQGAIYNMF